MDLMRRDPNDINNHVSINFEDVLAEPDSTHSFDCIWRMSHSCFSFWKACCYKLVTLLCGMCIAMYWGCEFAAISFNHIWCITPFTKACYIECGTWQRFWATCCNCCVAPCEFEDILGEPENIHSMECVWRLSYKCFNCCRNCCYTLMTLFCGICAAAYWGCIFAETAFSHIWCLTPTLHNIVMECVPCRKLYLILIDCFCGPLCETCGLLMSKIKITKG